jgi:hypothetical protein
VFEARATSDDQRIDRSPNARDFSVWDDAEAALGRDRFARASDYADFVRWWLACELERFVRPSEDFEGSREVQALNAAVNDEGDAFQCHRV